MASLARARFDDRPRSSSPVAGALHLLARAANDNAPHANLTSTTEGAAAVGSNPALNLTTTFTPDIWGNVTATTDPLTHNSNQTFDLDGRVLWAIAPDPGTGARPATRTSYDADGRAYQVDRGTTNAAGTTFTAAETTTTAFDPNGNKTQVSVLNGTAGSAALSVAQMSYDGLNRVICTAARENSGALPDACTQSAGGAYGPDPITMIGGACPRAGRRPDPGDLAGQELTETRGWGTPLVQAYTTFTWGADGEKTSVKDANSNTIHLGYDGFNRLDLITHPDATTETSVYDPDGDLVIWTNRGGFGVVRCYDVLNRKISETGITGASLSGACATGGTANLATRSWDIQNRTFGYDLAGRLTAANIPNFGLSYAYDAAGRPSAMSNARSASYGWDNAGNLNALTYPDGTTVVDYQYDPLNRTSKALIGTTPYGTLTYDALGRRQTLTFYDSSSQTWGYDNADRVTSIAHVFPNRTTDNVTYTCGGACPRAGRRPDPGDPSGRDASRTLDNSAYAYAPGAASTTYGTANALNQYPSVGSYTYSYWPEGGLDQTDKLQANYDEFGKLTLAYITVTPGTVDPNDFDFMGVDALDHVYYHGRQTTAGDTHPFIYHATDGLRPETIRDTQCTQTGGGVTTCTGTGTGTRLYVLGPDPDERWSFLDINGTIDSPHTDREGTLIALTNFAEAVAKYAYDAYGQNTNVASDVGPGPKSYLFRYTGQRLDPNTGLYDYKARDYSPVLGRFYQPDPAGVDQGPNLYEYVGDDPVDDDDPGGTESWLVAREIFFHGSRINHMFVVVAPSLGAPPQARFSYAPSHPINFSIRPWGSLVEQNGFKTETNDDDRAAWASLGSKNHTGVLAVRIDAPDAAVIASGQRVDQILGNIARPGPIKYVPLVNGLINPDSGNSNSAAIAVAEGATGKIQGTPGAVNAPGSGQASYINNSTHSGSGAEDPPFSIWGSQISGTRAQGTHVGCPSGETSC